MAEDSLTNVFKTLSASTRVFLRYVSLLTMFTCTRLHVHVTMLTEDGPQHLFSTASLPFMDKTINSITSAFPISTRLSCLILYPLISFPLSLFLWM